MGFSSEELQLFASAATGWNTTWKQHICCWDHSNDCRTVPQNLVSSLSRLASQKARVSSSVARATLLPAKTMLYWLCPSWGLISCICHVGSWNREAAEEKLCPWFPAGPSAPPWSMSSLPQHSTQEWAMHLTGWFKSWEVWSWPKCHEGVCIQCHFTEKWLLQTRSCTHYSWKWNKTVAVCAKMAAICLGDMNNHTLIRCYRWMTHLTHNFTFWKIRIIQIGTLQYFMLNGGRLIQ